MAVCSAKIEWGFFVEAFCGKATNEKVLALTFDDGPDKETTPILLDYLKQEQIKACFFCIGDKIESSEKILKRINEDGHIIGNHTFSHANLIDFYPEKKLDLELNKTNKIIKSVIGKEPNFFRPPYGVTTPAFARAITNTKMKVIGWNVRSFDTINKESKEVAERVLKKSIAGSVILFHDTTPHIVDILRMVIPELRNRGFKFVSVEELANLKAYKN